MMIIGCGASCQPPSLRHISGDGLGRYHRPIDQPARFWCDRGYVLCTRPIESEISKSRATRPSVDDLRRVSHPLMRGSHEQQILDDEERRSGHCACRRPFQYCARRRQQHESVHRRFLRRLQWRQPGANHQAPFFKTPSSWRQANPNGLSERQLEALSSESLENALQRADFGKAPSSFAPSHPHELSVRELQALSSEGPAWH